MAVKSKEVSDITIFHTLIITRIFWIGKFSSQDMTKWTLSGANASTKVLLLSVPPVTCNYIPAAFQSYAKTVKKKNIPKKKVYTLWLNAEFKNVCTYYTVFTTTTKLKA